MFGARIDFELKPKGARSASAALKFSFSSNQVSELFAAYQEALQLFEPGTVDGDNVTPMAAPAGGKRTAKAQEKEQQAHLNRAALGLLQKCIAVIPDFKGLTPLDLCKTLGFDKEPVVMFCSELQQVINLARSTVLAYAEAHPDASAYLEITGIIESAGTLEALEAGKAGFTRWGELSPNQALMIDAKRLYEEKKLLFETADALAADVAATA